MYHHDKTSELHVNTANKYAPGIIGYWGQKRWRFLRRGECTKDKQAIEKAFLKPNINYGAKYIHEGTIGLN